MPIGTTVRLAQKQSKLGCMDTLYKSVESLDDDRFNTKACKNMLLRPINASEEEYQKLPVKIDDTELTKYYICPTWSCCVETHLLISTLINAKCHCGKEMNRSVGKKKPKVVPDETEGIFVKRNTWGYMITDDLQVTPISSSSASLSLLKKLEVKYVTNLEELSMDVGKEEVLSLLKCCLASKTPLTDSLLRKTDPTDAIELDSSDIAPLNIGKGTCTPSKEMSVKLFRSMSENKVLYAEGNEEFLDLLYSFLAFPLGSIVHILGATSSCSLGCVDKLYKSVESLDIVNHFKSEKCKEKLLTPKLAPYFGSKHQFLSIGEASPWCCNVTRCSTCFDHSTDPGFGQNCSHGFGRTTLKPMNPKYMDVQTASGGGFMKGSSEFMVTDDLIVNPLSHIKIISLLNQLKLPITDIEEKVVTIGEEEALKLLKAILISKGPLSYVFSDKKPSRRKIY